MRRKAVDAYGQWDTTQRVCFWLLACLVALFAGLYAAVFANWPHPVGVTITILVVADVAALLILLLVREHKEMQVMNQRWRQRIAEIERELARAEAARREEVERAELGDEEYEAVFLAQGQQAINDLIRDVTGTAPPSDEA